MFQPRASLPESLALLCKSWHRPAGECEVTPFSGSINRLPGQAPVSTEHRRGDEGSWGARVAWGSEAGLLRPGMAVAGDSSPAKLTSKASGSRQTRAGVSSAHLRAVQTWGSCSASLGEFPPLGML